MNIPHGIVVSLQTFIQVKSMVCGLYPTDTTAHMNLYAYHQFLQYFTEETVSIGLKNKFRVGTPIPLPDRSTDPCPTHNGDQI